jgi:2-methylisocitrate lyase-like PEP mutase family enzyme
VPELFVNARTDAFWLAVADPLPEALARCATYARAGADGVFVPGIATGDDISALVAVSAVPLNVLFLPGRHTVAGLASLGVHRISLGSLLFRTALHATVRTAEAIAAGRPIDTGVPGYADVVSLVETLTRTHTEAHTETPGEAVTDAVPTTGTERLTGAAPPVTAGRATTGQARPQWGRACEVKGRNEASS